MSGGAELAVIVPTLDEAAHVPLLLDDLSVQVGISLEVVVADGGSVDGTLRLVRERIPRSPFPMAAVACPRGRGRQLNEGVRATGAPELLFLHADSRLAPPTLLADASRAMGEPRHRGTDRVAGHFGLRFVRSQPGPSLPYFFSECKSHLNRPGCINGDQGFWLSRRYFLELGAFDEDSCFFEDALLAARVAATGNWIELPGCLSTSARRFEVEGFGARQTLNAILRAADRLALTEFFDEAHGAYREQAGAGPLDVLPFLRLAHRSLWSRGAREGIRRWWEAGEYAASQAWQLAFWLDCRRRFREGREPGARPHRWLDAFDRLGAPLLKNPAVRGGAGVLAALWFYSLLARSSLAPARGSPRLDSPPNGRRPAGGPHRRCSTSAPPSPMRSRDR